MADIVELFSLEYMTALGMTMLLLFLDSRYSRRLTALTVGGVALLVMAAVAALYQVWTWRCGSTPWRPTCPPCCCS